LLIGHVGKERFAVDSKYRYSRHDNSMEDSMGRFDPTEQIGVNAVQRLILGELGWIFVSVRS
jgi:hypothetical protein